MLHNNVIDGYDFYIYIDIDTGAVSDLEGYVSGLKTRRLARLAPLRTFTGKMTDINLKIARSFYVMYIRTVITSHTI